MRKIFSACTALEDRLTHYCPGCTHGVIQRLVGEVIEELGILGQTVGVAPVGCAVLSYQYFACDMFEASHGRAPAVATGAKRARPKLIVFCYQGDGDLASIGLGEILHAANRGEKITVIFVNNAIYGMTGGQLAPTTMPGQHTTTTPNGRDVKDVGYPVRMAELISTLTTPAFVARGAAHTAAAITQTKKLIRQAFQHQINGTCFSFVEVLSTCPTNWGLSPHESEQWLEREMLPYYTLGIKKRPEDFVEGVRHG
jgi:2-oxoglutarate ferredoxin oxidoreductase subunit beta